MIRPEDENVVKIGIAEHPLNRLKALQASCWKLLYIAGLVPGTQKLESLLHDAFEKYRIHGEWFREADAIMRWTFELPATEPYPYGFIYPLLWQDPVPDENPMLPSWEDTMHTMLSKHIKYAFHKYA